MNQVTADPNERIFAFQHELAKLPQVELKPIHTFLPGIYIRTLVVPKGAAVTGCVHHHTHASFVIGDITVTTKDGTERLTGMHMVIATPGTKRAVYAHETTIWRTVHPNPTEERDIQKLEAMFVIPETLEDALSYRPKELQ